MSGTQPLIAAVAAGLLGVLPGSAAELDELFSERWYRTEVIIFERRNLPTEGSERLAFSTAPNALDRRAYPARMHAMRFGPEETARRYPIWRDGCFDMGPPIIDPRLAVPSQPPSIDPETEAPTGLEPGPTQAARVPEMTNPEPAPDPLAGVRALVSALEEQYFEDSFTWLPANRLALTSQARRLDRRAGFNVIFHGAWQQPVPQRSAPSPVLFQEGRKIGGLHQLDGYLGVTVGRYLHFNAELWLTRPPTITSPPTDALSTEPAVDPERQAAIAAGPVVARQLGARPLGARPPPQPTYLRLSESRRMRSGELNYLDHPLFGILVRIDPLEPSADLVAAFKDATADSPGR